MAKSKYPSTYGKKQGGGNAKLYLGVILVVIGIFLGITAMRGSPEPTIELVAELPAIGQKTAFTAVVKEPERGLSSILVEVVQGDTTKTMGEATFTPRSVWTYWGDLTASHKIAFEVGKASMPELKPGEVTVRVTAGRAPGLLGAPNPVVYERTYDVKLVPPLLQVQTEHVYVAQGGVEALVYSVEDTAIRHGVEAGKWFFPGYPLPGHRGQYFALFAVPFDMDSPKGLKLVAEDALGNVAVKTDFVHQFFPKPMPSDTINLNEKFMQKVVTEILPRTPNLEDKQDLLKNYLMLNGELRKENRAELRRIAQTSKKEFLWKEPFLPMKNAAVKGSFADARTYMFNGNAVDHQTHLGFDLASVAQAEVESANAGVVAVAHYFGIYGNCVIVDHGYGLMSLYAHLSSFAVKEGDTVTRGQVLGRTGNTGMAGGDHLHFTMLLQGLPVRPVEWWDSHWLNDRIKLKLGDALPYPGEAG